MVVMRGESRHPFTWPHELAGCRCECLPLGTWVSRCAPPSGGSTTSRSSSGPGGPTPGPDDEREVVEPPDGGAHLDTHVPNGRHSHRHPASSCGQVNGCLDSPRMTTIDDHGRPEPPVAADEVATLLGFLDYQRATLEWKTRGLDAAGLGAHLAPTSMTLGGLLK